MASAIAHTLLEWSPQSQTMRAMLSNLKNDQEKRTKKKDFESEQDKKKSEKKNQMMFTLKAGQE